MPFSINIRSDDPSSSRIRDLWTLCGRLEEQPTMVALGYPPHFTLAAFDDAQEAELAAIVEGLAAALSRVTVLFDRVSTFETPSSVVLWAAPAEPGLLGDIHRQVHARVDPGSCWPHCRPDAWIPHSTLAMHVDQARREEAMALARAGIAPFEVVFDVIDCARFHPVEVMHERDLPVAATPLTSRADG